MSIAYITPMVLVHPNVDLWLSYSAPRTLGGMLVVRRPILTVNDSPHSICQNAQRWVCSGNFHLSWSLPLALMPVLVDVALTSYDFNITKFLVKARDQSIRLTNHV